MLITRKLDMMSFFKLQRHQVAVKLFCVSIHQSAPHWNDRYGADWFALSVEVFRQVVVLFCPGGLGGVHLDGYVVQVAKVAKGLIKRIS